MTRLLAAALLASCAAPALPPAAPTQQAACARYARAIGEAKLYGATVRLEAHGTFTAIEVRNELHLSPITASTAGKRFFIRPGQARRWTADSRFVAVSQALLSYVPGKVTVRATVCEGSR